MKSAPLATLAAILAMGMPAYAHRLDEYLQATTISLEKDRVKGQIRLTPGVAVLPRILAAIDENADGVISAAEQQAYAEKVLGDVALAIDGNSLRPQLVSVNFPRIEEMREGLGEIQIEIQAELPRNGTHQRLTFENHHQSQIAAYLVNCLVPSDPNLRVVSQYRNYPQSFYQVDYEQTSVGSGSPLVTGAGASVLLAAATVLLFAGLAFFARQRAAT
jgi:hypothetical protein